jgi:hypothetical protein
MLRHAGGRGVHTFEMRAAFIGNPSERIARLERRGHRIRVSERERLNGGAYGVRYFLETDAQPHEMPDSARAAGMPRESAAAPPERPLLAAGAGTGSLFDADAFAERGDWRDVPA